jgi:hypothetical protein
MNTADYASAALSLQGLEHTGSEGTLIELVFSRQRDGLRRGFDVVSADGGLHLRADIPNLGCVILAQEDLAVRDEDDLLIPVCGRFEMIVTHVSGSTSRFVWMQDVGCRINERHWVTDAERERFVDLLLQIDRVVGKAGRFAPGTISRGLLNPQLSNGRLWLGRIWEHELDLARQHANAERIETAEAVLREFCMT